MGLLMVHEQLTTGEAAKTAGLSIATIKRKIQSKQLHAKRDADGDWTIQHADLMVFLAHHKPSTRNGASASSRSPRVHELTMNRLEEVNERENRELKNERARLIEKLELVERENRDLRREYNAMIEKLLAEKDVIIREMKTGSSPGKTNAIEDIPTRFLSKLKRVANAIRD